MPYQTTYAGLKADLIQHTEDYSIDLLANIDTIIALAENMVAHDLDLELFQGESVAGNTTAGTPTISRPTIKAQKSVWITVAGKKIPVARRSYDFCLMLAPDPAAQVTPALDNIYYAERDNGTWYLAPTPDGAYAVTGFGVVIQSSLGDSVPTTWISTNVGDLLFKGCLAQAEQFLKNQDMAQTWKGDYADLLAKTQLIYRGAKRADYELARQASTASQPL